MSYLIFFIVLYFIFSAIDSGGSGSSSSNSSTSNDNPEPSKPTTSNFSTLSANSSYHSSSSYHSASTTPCPSCYNGLAKCRRCYGQGQLECSYCDGTGRGSWEHDDPYELSMNNGRCTYCSMVGYNECHPCRGEGYGPHACSTCGGSGEI
jgi:hypothetical protein